MKKAACCAVALMIAAPAHAANLPLRVGWNTELSGPWTFFGSACMNAVQMAEAEVNASAKRIEIIPRDNQTNPAQAAAAHPSRSGLLLPAIRPARPLSPGAGHIPWPRPGNRARQYGRIPIAAER